MEIQETNIRADFVFDTIREMIRSAKEGNLTLKQEINGVTVMVNGDSDVCRIFRDHERARSGYINGVIGPYPKHRLTDEEVASEDRHDAERERRQQKLHAEYKAKAMARDKAKQETVEVKLTDAPNIELSDEAGWQKFKTVNSDSYGGAVVTCSERWARLMQVEMTNGKKLEDVADATFSEANLEYLEGSMFDQAVLALASFWEYGEQLQHWCDIRTQIWRQRREDQQNGDVTNFAFLWAE